MSDFLAWLSPLPMPAPIRRRWNWSVTGRIGVRRQPWSPLGQAVCQHSQGATEVVTVGEGRGERGRRYCPRPDPQARRLMGEFRTREHGRLDHYLGPVAGIYVDTEQDRTLVWRDRFGRHPIQMIRLRQGWAITTSPHLAPWLLDAEPRWSHLVDFIHGTHRDDDADVLTNLYRIRPSELVVFDGDRIQSRRRWWNPERVTIDDPLSTMRSILGDIGTFFGRSPHLIALSGGLDSATLAALAAAHHPGHRTVTFCDPQSRRDEGDLAAELARALSLKWSSFEISDHWPLSRIDDHRFPPGWGPPAHPDFAWKMPLHRWMARRHHTLPLMYGNGADEALWISPRHWLRSRWYDGDVEALTAAYSHLPLTQWLRPALSAAIDRWGLRSWRHTLPNWPDTTPRWQQPGHWIGPPNQSWHYRPAADPDRRLYEARLRRLQSWQWERVMRSLAFEARRGQRIIHTPFLDAQFWELSLSLSPSTLVQGGRQKAVLRQAAATRLPRPCRHRPKIGGFDAVVERGLVDRASHTVYALFGPAHLGQWSRFDRQAFARAYESYRRRPTGSEAGDPIRGSWAIWRTIASELWLRHCGAVHRHRR